MLQSDGKNKHPVPYGQQCYMSMHSTDTKTLRNNSIISKMTILEIKMPHKHRNPQLCTVLNTKASAVVSTYFHDMKHKIKYHSPRAGFP